MSLSLNVALHGRIEGEATFCATSRFIGITGPSGAGKSSFLRCIAGFEKRGKGSGFVAKPDSLKRSTAKNWDRFPTALIVSPC